MPHNGVSTMRVWLLSSVIFTILSSASAQAQAPMVLEQMPPKPRIVVTGFGEIKTMPDVATIGYVVRGEGATSDEAVTALTASDASINAALHGSTELPSLTPAT